MRRVLGLAIATVVIAGATGCAVTHLSASHADSRVVIPADLPPSPTTWPPYPHFSEHSCWARPYGGPVQEADGVAPSYAAASQTHPTAPAVIARRLLAGFGDRRYVRSINLTPAPPAVGRRVRVLYAGGHPPTDALQAEVVVPAASNSGHLSPEENFAAGIAQYEGDIIGGALRDDLCDAGGAPLVMWAAGNGGGGFAESFRALGQRFPNPSPAAFRKRVALVGQRFGFTVASLRLLRPRQIAPLLIVETHRPRKAFMKDIPRVTELLNPHSFANHRSGLTFEGFFFAAEDANGPFTWSLSVVRNDNTGGGWAAKIGRAHV